MTTTTDPRYAPFIGREIPPGKPWEVKADHIAQYSRAVGESNPECLAGKIAPPSYANACIGKSVNLGNMLNAMKGLVKNLGKIVHGSQNYEYLEPVKAGDQLTTGGRLVEAYEKNKMLWVGIELETRNQQQRVVLKTRLVFVVRPGGF